MPEDTGKYGYPVKPFDPGPNLMQQWSEALGRQQERVDAYRRGEQPPMGSDSSLDDWNKLEQMSDLMNLGWNAPHGVMAPADCGEKKK